MIIMSIYRSQEHNQPQVTADTTRKDSEGKKVRILLFVNTIKTVLETDFVTQNQHIE